MSKIVVIGSSNMDYTVYVDKSPNGGETVSGSTRNIVPGGKGCNQAIAAYRAKGDVSFVCSLGKDADGNSIRSLLKKEGIKSEIEESKSETGNATIIVDKNAENRIVVVPGANKTLSFKFASKHISKETKYIVLQNEIDLKTNEEICKKYSDKFIVYNPAPAKELSKNIIKNISYFIVNETELAFYGKKDSTEENIKVLLKQGIKNVLVTLGSKGSMIANKDGVKKVKAFKVKAVDTVAAGDTYLGYFVAALSNGEDEVSAMELASKASAIAVTKNGALCSIPTLNVVNKFKF